MRVWFIDEALTPAEAENMSMQHPDVPGEPTSPATSFRQTATGAIQGLGPVNKIHQHLCAFHFYADDMSRQVEAHHFCSHQNEEMRQCLIYDSPNADARLIGVEYLVSEKVFMSLPDTEKPLWHSHQYEVKSGMLFMPGVPGPLQKQELDKVAKTYGKIFHFWQVDKGHSLPLGLPQPMMAFTRDGQLYDHMAQDVEKRFGVSYKEQREKRTDITGPEHGIHPLANAAGEGLKTVVRETIVKPPTAIATP